MYCSFFSMLTRLCFSTELLIPEVCERFSIAGSPGRDFVDSPLCVQGGEQFLALGGWVNLVPAKVDAHWPLKLDS